MFSLRFVCPAHEVDSVSGELWQAGTAGIRELESDSGTVLIAWFETNEKRADLLARFEAYSPEWTQEPATDWVKQTRLAWPTQAIGTRLFLAPVWSEEPTPPGRERVIHNPGLACGTGEHPCTQLAMVALESCVTPGCRVIDIGTGSGILALAAFRLGAALAIGVDRDEAALAAATENFKLNGYRPELVAGSAGCIARYCADVVVANISATVLLSLADDLREMGRPNARLILTGFAESELWRMEEVFGSGHVSRLAEWRLLSIMIS